MTDPTHHIALWWIKRDLRVTDNPALTWCLRNGRSVLPVYILEPAVVGGPDSDPVHYALVLQALRALRVALRERGADLLLLNGDLPDAFASLRRRVPFSAIGVEEETGLEHTFTRDLAVRRWCAENQVHLEETPRDGVIRGLTNRDRRMEIWRGRMEAPVLPAPNAIPLPPVTLPHGPDVGAAWGVDEMETLTERMAGRSATPGMLPHDHELLQRCTPASAAETLDSFLRSRSNGYRAGMSGMNTAPEVCSRISVHLAWGTMSLREVYQAVTARQKELREMETSVRRATAPRVLGGLSAFASRLHWHDHFIQRLEREPETEFSPINRAFDRLEVADDPALLERWLSGTTGFPYADAAMRCLAATGWLNFRSRAMLVSLACHVLHLSWRTILYPLARLMADYLPGIHVSQTQMQAGVTGINTLRIYSPMKQLRDHDPDCEFVRRWVPELRDRSPEEIHAAADGMDLSPYPAPAVDYRQRTREMRGRVSEIKRSAEGRREAERVLSVHGSRKRDR